MIGVALAVTGGVIRLVTDLIGLKWSDYTEFADVLSTIILNALIIGVPVALLASTRLRSDQRWTGVAGGISAVLGTARATNYLIYAVAYEFDSGKYLFLDLVSLAGSAALIAAGGLLLRSTFPRR